MNKQWTWTDTDLINIRDGVYDNDLKFYKRHLRGYRDHKILLYWEEWNCTRYYRDLYIRDALKSKKILRSIDDTEGYNDPVLVRDINDMLLIVKQIKHINNLYREVKTRYRMLKN